MWYDAISNNLTATPLCQTSCINLPELIDPLRQSTEHEPKSLDGSGTLEYVHTGAVNWHVQIPHCILSLWQCTERRLFDLLCSILHKKSTSNTAIIPVQKGLEIMA